MREYQQHSSEVEAAWRVQDEKDNNKEAKDCEAQGSRAKASEDKEERQEAPGEALMREIRESAEAVDEEIREYEAEEENKRRKSEKGREQKDWGEQK